MRIAVAHPTAWPWIRRGSERVLNDLSLYLSSCGHDVTVITSSPDGRGEDRVGPVRRILLPQRLPRLRHVRQLNSFHAFALDCARAVREGGFDAVHCLNYHEAWGILRQRGNGPRPRVVYQMTGIPVARYFRAVPLDRMMVNRVMRQADQIICLSNFASACMQRDFGRRGILIPSPTDTAPFMAAMRTRPARPRILFCGDADEPRKGALLLARAFARLDRPDLELHLSGRCSDRMAAGIRACLPPDRRQQVVIHGIGDVTDLPGLYASAAVVVNPAVWEALGNVLIEALASGTPVVGCDHGGIPDIIDSDRIGALFAPAMRDGVATDADALCAAMTHALALSDRPDTVAACRARAMAFSWDRLGPLYEAALTDSRAEVAA